MPRGEAGWRRCVFPELGELQPVRYYPPRLHDFASADARTRREGGLGPSVAPQERGGGWLRRFEDRRSFSLWWAGSRPR